MQSGRLGPRRRQAADGADGASNCRGALGLASEVARQPAVAAAAAAEEVRQPARICLACETIYLEILGNR